MSIKVRHSGVWVNNTQEKKRVNGAWVSNEPYKIMKPYISGVPPFTFKSDGENLRDWSMSGQTVDASGVGDKTGNLICASQTGSSTAGGLTLTYTQGSSAVTLDKDTTSGAVFGTVPTSITLAAGTYAVSVQNLLVKVANTYDRIYLVDSNNTVVVNYVMSDAPKSFTLAAEATISKMIFVCDPSSVYDNATITIMLNAGSTAQSFEPYGYKIPITCGGQTTNIYLDAPLMDGDTISKTSTGVDIPTTNGSNTLAVNTTVQPSGMTIQSISQWV